MRVVHVRLKSLSPYSQSRMHETSRLQKNEGDEAYENRTWREKCTTDKSGQLLIPAMAFKQALDRASQVLGMKTGKGRNTFSKHFVAGCVCTANVPIGVYKKDVQPVRVHCNVSGVRGSGKRVFRIFPLIPEWEGNAEFAIYDDTITQDVFEEHLCQAGSFVGVGRYRPQNGGLYGRFEPTAFNWVMPGPTAEEASEMELEPELEAAE